MLSRITLLVCLLAISIATSSVRAQAPQAAAFKKLKPAASLLGIPDPDNPDRTSDSQKKAKRNRSASLRVIRDLLSGRGAALAGREKQIFEYYYRSYLFALMSQTDSENLAAWPKRRADLLKQLRGAQSKAAHDHLVAMIIFPQMKLFVTENYHPAVRYNAMLLIGGLNTIEPSTIDRQPPRPYAEALTFMLDQLENAQQIDAVKVGALIGILRHVDLNRQLGPEEKFITGDDVKLRIVNAARAIVLQKDPPANRSREGHIWMQRRALEVMASSGVSGDDRSFESALATIADPDAPMSLRCTAAAVLPKFLAVKPTVAKNVAEKLGSLTAHFCLLEIDRVQRQQQIDALRKQVEDAGGIAGTSSGLGAFEGDDEAPAMGMDGPEMGMGMGFGGGNAAAKADPRAYRIQVTRRRLLYQLMCTSSMLHDMKDWTIEDPAQKDFVTRVSNLVDGITNVAVGDSNDAPEGLEVASAGDMDSLVNEIKTAVAKLEAVTPAPKKPGAQAAPMFDPAAQAAAPAAQPKQPAAQPKQPAAQPKQPAAQPKQPAAQPKQPAAQPKQPAAEEFPE